MIHEQTESVKLRNRFLLGLGVIILFFVPATIMLVNKFGYKESEIINKINNTTTFLILVKDYDSDYKDLEDILKDYKTEISYEILDSTEEDIYKRILNKLSLTTTDIKEPSIIFVKKGEVYSILVNPNKKELLTYMNNLEEEWS